MLKKIYLSTATIALMFSTAARAQQQDSAQDQPQPVELSCSVTVGEGDPQPVDMQITEDGHYAVGSITTETTTIQIVSGTDQSDCCGLTTVDNRTKASNETPMRFDEEGKFQSFIRPGDSINGVVDGEIVPQEGNEQIEIDCQK
jgi:hypothetical protein